MSTATLEPAEAAAPAYSLALENHRLLQQLLEAEKSNAGLRAQLMMRRAVAGGGDRAVLNQELAAANLRLVQKLRQLEQLNAALADVGRQQEIKLLRQQLLVADQRADLLELRTKKQELKGRNGRLREAVDRKIAAINELRTILQAAPGISVVQAAYKRMTELQAFRAELVELSDSGLQANDQPRSSLADALGDEVHLLIDADSAPAKQTRGESLPPGAVEWVPPLDRYIDQSGPQAVAAIDDIHAALEQEAAAAAADQINQPRHYTSHPSGIECIQITEHMGFALGNAVKYIWRADLKEDAIQDLHKAQWYIARELQKRGQAGAVAR